jgi:hypothetical protein
MNTKTREHFYKEELSRILSAHEGKQLIRNGRYWTGTDGSCAGGCINQVALLEPNPIAALQFHRVLATWFDHSYNPSMSSDELLAKIEEITCSK